QPAPAPSRTRCWEPASPPVVTMAETPDVAAAPPREALRIAVVAAPGLAPKKRKWEESLGGSEAAKLRIQARLAGWPSALQVDRTALPAADPELLLRIE